MQRRTDQVQRKTTGKNRDFRIVMSLLLVAAIALGVWQRYASRYHVAVVLTTTVSQLFTILDHHITEHGHKTRVDEAFIAPVVAASQETLRAETADATYTASLPLVDGKRWLRLVFSLRDPSICSRFSAMVRSASFRHADPTAVLGGYPSEQGDRAEVDDGRCLPDGGDGVYWVAVRLKLGWHAQRSAVPKPLT